MQGLHAEVRTPDRTHSNVIEDPLELQWLILSLHGSGVETIAAVNELDDVAGGAAYCQVVLRAQILQGLHQTPLYRNTRLYDIGMATGVKCNRLCSCVSVCVSEEGMSPDPQALPACIRSLQFSQPCPPDPPDRP